MKKQIAVTFLSVLMVVYSPMAFANKNESYQLSGSAEPTAKPAPVESAPPAEPAALAEPIEPSVEYVRVKMGKSIFLDPPESDEPAIYVRIRDTSGNDFDVHETVKKNLQDNGFKPVRNAKNANYVLQANLLFAEEVSEAELQKINESDFDQNIVEVVASAAGDAVNVVTGDNNTPEAGSPIDAMLGIISSVSNKVKKQQKFEDEKVTKIFSVVIDIEVRQRSESEFVRTGVSTLTLAFETDTQSNSSSSETDVARTEEKDAYTIKSKWVRYRVRAIASAKGKHITLEDVRDQITDKMSKAISGMF